MNYKKWQIKKTLKQIENPRSKKYENEPKRTKWEIQETQLKKKEQIKKHRQYILRRKKQEYPKKISVFSIVDNNIHNLANQQGRVISFSKIYQLLLKDYFDNWFNSSPSKFTLQEYIHEWLSYQNNNPSHTFIRSYDKSAINNSTYYLSCLYNTGFMDSHDIKNKLGFKSIKSANRILNPVTKFKPTPEHLPANKLFKVYHLVQAININGKKINKKYGINKPVTVVSKLSYSAFIKFNYKNNHLTLNYSKSHFSSFGQKLYNLYIKSKPQQKAQMFLKLAIKNILTKTISDERAKLNKTNRRLDEKDQLIGNFIKVHNDINYHTLMKQYPTCLTLLIFKDNINDTKAKESKAYQDILKHGKQELAKLNKLRKQK